MYAAPRPSAAWDAPERRGAAPPARAADLTPPLALDAPGWRAVGRALGEELDGPANGSKGVSRNHSGYEPERLGWAEQLLCSRLAHLESQPTVQPPAPRPPACPPCTRALSSARLPRRSAPAHLAPPRAAAAAGSTQPHNLQVAADARGWVPALLYNEHLGSAVGLWPRAGGGDDAPDPARDFFAAAAPALFAPAAPVAALLSALRAALPPRARGGGPRRLVGLHVRVGREGEAKPPPPPFLVLSGHAASLTPY